MTGYQNFVKKFKVGNFVSSRDIAKTFNFSKALTSLYVFPTFFKGVYYIPMERERKGRFVEKPAEFFSNLFNFVYGRKKWYWSLSTAARRYGREWSATKILEIVTPHRYKTIEIASRAETLQKKRSYRSKTLAEILSALGINAVHIHKGKKQFLKEIKIDPEMGPIATKERLKRDILFFLPRTKKPSLRRLYKKYLERL